MAIGTAPPPPAASAVEALEPPAPALRRRLIEIHLPLVRALALRFARRGEPLDDLIQVGCVGLIHAVDRYDPRRGHTFEAYAIPTITGEIRRHLRDACAGVRVPRRVAEERARVHSARCELEARTGRPASASDIARAAGVSATASAAALSASRPEPLDADGTPATDPIVDLDVHLALMAALRALPHRERRILLLSFYGECSQRRIAAELGLSQIHVSRVRREALQRLRSALEEGGPVATPGGEA